jgi:hypothetical protein
MTHEVVETNCNESYYHARQVGVDVFPIKTHQIDNQFSVPQ